MQVYLLNGDGVTDYSAAFRNFQDIKPSLQISYSACKDVKIEMTGGQHGVPVFTVTGFYSSDPVKPFTEIFKVVRIPVWDSPTHI